MTLREAVVRLADRLDEDVTWAVTASANLALRGYPVDPGDVDVMADADGVYRIAEAFTDRVTRPVRPPERAEGDRIRSHYGALELAGVEVELMGGVEHYVDGEWQSAGDVADERETITVAGREIPAMSLAHERRGYRDLGRDDRVALIEEGTG